MLDPTFMLFNNHKEAIIFFAGFLAYIAVLSFFGYREASSKEEKKDALAFLSVFGSLAVVSLIIAGYFNQISGV